MIHTAEHDPILGDEWSHGCAACEAARNSTFAQLRKIVPGLGPYDTDGFIERMKAMAQDHLKLVVVDRRSAVYDWDERGDL